MAKKEELLRQLAAMKQPRTIAGQQPAANNSLAPYYDAKYAELGEEPPPRVQISQGDPGFADRQFVRDSRKRFPSLTDAGLESANTAIQAGTTDFQSLLKNTVGELGARHKPENIQVTRDVKSGDFSIGVKDPETGRVSDLGVGKKLKGILEKRDNDFFVNSKVDTKAGAGAMVRAGLSFRDKPIGKANFLVESYGKGNVYLFSTGKHAGKFAVNLNPKGQNWVMTDEEGLTFKDMADLAGDTARNVPGIAGSLIGAAGGRSAQGAMIGGMIGDVVGEAIFQGVSEAIPGESGTTLGEGATEAALTVASGVLPDVVSAGVGAAKRAIGPTGLVGGQLAREVLPESMEELFAGTGKKGVEAAAERLVLSEKHGVDLSAAQLTQGLEALGFEDILRSKKGGIQVFGVFDDHQAKQFGRAVDDVISRVGKDGVDPDAAGKQVAGAYGKFVGRLRQLRRDKVAPLFKAAAESGEVVPVDNFLRAIDNRLAELPERGATGTTLATINGLKKLKKDFTESVATDSPAGPGFMTPTEIQNKLAEYGKQSKGVGLPFKDIDSASGRLEAGILFGALQKDLNSAQGALTKEARKAYRNMSVPIELARNSLLNKSIKMMAPGVDTPALFVAEFLTDKAASPRRIRKTMMVLRRNDPEAAKALQRSVLESFVEDKAEAAGATAVSRAGGDYSPVKFATKMLNKKNGRKLRALLGEKAYGEVRELAEIAQTIASTSATGSRTYIRQSLGGFWDKMARSASEPKQARNELLAAFGARQFAMAMVRPGDREIMLKLAKAPPSMKTRQANKMIQKLIINANRDHETEGAAGPTGLGGLTDEPPIAPRTDTGIARFPGATGLATKGL